MRLIVSTGVTPPAISQVLSKYRGPVSVNGRAEILFPDGVDIPVNQDDHVLPQDSTAVSKRAFDEYLRLNRDFSFLKFNSLISAADMGKLDHSASFVLPGSTAPWASRFYGGRASSPAGLLPGSVCIPPTNSAVSPSRPGVVITDTIDISGDAPTGADRFLVWWGTSTISLSHDVMVYGSGNNLASVKTSTPSPSSSLSGYISTNDGASWDPIESGRALHGCSRGTSLRVALVNTGSSRVYLNGYAVLY